MINGLTGIMKLLSGKKQKIQVIETIKIGSKWVPINKSPWSKPFSSVTILDVKDGWVRYDMGGVFRDERMGEDIFLMIYKEVECV